ncbi:MAG TPA: HAMP domain-containing sensor histidine kinase [Nocardioides sp.]|jgi:signal transduction histidine kinase|nr:HAMP domain-containing sensor histidine kinase [Nocardioides sp.]
MASTSDGRIRESRLRTLWSAHQVEFWWWVFVAVNAWGILMLREWATVPFHFIWIGLSLIYGWRVWSIRATAAALGVIVVVTGAALLADVISGNQAVDELTEIPLMSAVFIAMVFYVRRSAGAQRETERMSEHNLALLEESRRLVQDASHVLRTPLTIALGHAELLQRTTSDPDAAEDAQVVVDELHRLKKTTDRLLELAKSEQPDFLYPVETSLGHLVTTTVTRWTGAHAEVQLGPVEDTVAWVDPDRVAEALDEVIGNAIVHTPPGTPISVSAHREDGHHVVAVSDRGPGVPDAALPGIFDRFAHSTESDHRGVGLGLAIVQAICERHGGTARVRSRPGGGSVFELRLPATNKSTANGVLPDATAATDRVLVTGPAESGPAG